MCIAVAKPRDIKVRKKVLKECFRNNPDGVGFAYPSKKEKKVEIHKGYFSFRQFWADYRKIQETGCPMIIHFRIATSGKVDGENCHPWRINKKHALIHNGILAHKIDLEHEDVSDTGLFTEHFFKPIFAHGPALWLNPAFKWLIEESIGNTNKIAILSADGEIRIFNEKQGEWDAGIWFSNKSYKEKRVKRTTTWTPARTEYGLHAKLPPKVSLNKELPLLSLPAPKPPLITTPALKEPVEEDVSRSF
jgi:hypothetical protein